MPIVRDVMNIIQWILCDITDNNNIVVVVAVVVNFVVIFYRSYAAMLEKLLYLRLEIINFKKCIFF